RITDEQLRDVHAERLVGEVPHLLDLFGHLVELTRRRLDDPERARVRHRGGELRACDVAHRCLHDRVLDAEEIRHPCLHLYGLALCTPGYPSCGRSLDYGTVP